MTAGIIIPSELEANILLSFFKQDNCKIIQSKPFYTGEINKVPIILTISGIGKANSAHTTGLLIQMFNPSIIINIGVAGAYPLTGLTLGDLVIARSERYIDEGLNTLNGRFFCMKDLGISITGQDNLDLFKLHIPKNIPKEIFIGDFATVSTCTGSLSRGISIAKDFGCICENMEGSAIAHICHYNNIPFTEFRGISNTIGDRDGRGIDKDDLLKSSKKVQAFFIENIKFFVEGFN